MDRTISPLFVKRRGVVLSISPRDQDAVVLELNKLKKPEVQVATEKLNEIVNLHEGVLNGYLEKLGRGHKGSVGDMYCAECDQPFPCATYNIAVR